MENKLKIDSDLKRDQFVIIPGFLNDHKVGKVLEELKEVERSYTPLGVENKLFRERETHDGRKGDAVMVTTGYPDSAPFYTLNAYEELLNLAKVYHEIVGEALDENIEDGKLLMNWQEYYARGDNSLPMHVDVELIKGDWGKYTIEFDEGLIPRYVMVLVTKNNNGGKGLAVEINGKITTINLFKGDVIIFDNTAMLHGVPESTPEDRFMLGFRSFEAKPLYFNKEEFDGSTPYKNGHNIGFVKELTTDEAKEILHDTGWYY